MTPPAAVIDAGGGGTRLCLYRAVPSRRSGEPMLTLTRGYLLSRHSLEKAGA